MTYPTRDELRDFAGEEAQIKVRALLQTFAMPNVDEDMIHKLLVDALTNTYVAGYAGGWDAAIDETISQVKTVERYRQEQR